MATEKDKTKAAAVKMYLNEHPALGKNGPVDWEQIEFAMRFYLQMTKAGREVTNG